MTDKTSHKPKVILLGSSGMLGIDMAKAVLSYGYELIPLSRADLDITNANQVMSLSKFGNCIVINCAAYTNVDVAEEEREVCYQTNVVGVKNLVDLALATDAIFVQISTDYVFDGNKGPYYENAKKNPINHYGTTKSLAEDIIVNDLKKYYIIRTSWLYGHQGKNFVDTILNIAKKQDQITVISDQAGCPTRTEDLAKQTLEIIGLPFGIYHVTGSGTCSWYEFAQEIVNQKNLHVEIKPCSSSEYPQKAMRPKNSVLGNSKLKNLPTWQSSLKVYLDKS